MFLHHLSCVDCGSQLCLNLMQRFMGHLIVLLCFRKRESLLSTVSQAALCVAGLMRGERQPIQVRPQAMLEARDLPKCEISDFLQERIDNALSSELIQRSKQEGVPPDQVSCILWRKHIQGKCRLHHWPLFTIWSWIQYIPGCGLCHLSQTA